jgi:hypothetical protein
MSTKKGPSKKAIHAASAYRQGRARGAYHLRKEISAGLNSSPGGSEGVCRNCKTLLDLRDIFNSFVHSGNDLKKRRVGYPKPSDAAYRNVKKQNEYLLKTVFDGKGNYVYHRECIRHAFGVGTQRLSRLRRVVREKSSTPFLELPKEEVHRYSDIVLPKGCEEQASTWLLSQPDEAVISCRNNPQRHGNAGKRSHHAKSEIVLQRFTEFIDCNSSPNGRKEGSHGATFYFNPKFYTLRTPNPDDPQYEYKCKHSVLYEFNRTLEEEGVGKISIGTFHSWLKQHRPYVGICPSQSDYCDKCKEYNEEIARARQIANRLKQSGHSTEESIREQEQAMVHYTALLQQHKEEAQAGLEYYKRLASEAESMYKHICTMQQLELTPERSAELKKLQQEYSVFISADYMMGKNLPHWGKSAQPSKTYYMMKLVCDVFGIVDHSSNKEYAYLCDEVAAGSKSTDHTLTFFDHYIRMYVDEWVRHLTLCLDNARICKNQYLVAWAVELVEKNRFDSVRFFYMTVGHTKFAPDKLFSCIAKTFYNSDVYCIEMLDHIAQQHATSLVFTSRLMLHWKAALELKYPAVPGITGMHDILVTTKLGKVVVSYRDTCFSGEYTIIHNYKYDPKQQLLNPSPYEPVELTAEKLRQLTEQHRRYIKQDIPLYTVPTFLQPAESSADTSRNGSGKQQKKQKLCTYPGCDGSGNVNPGRKRHLTEKNCPLATKKSRN